MPFLLLLLVGLTHVAQWTAGAPLTDLTRLFEHFLPPHDTRPGQDPFALVETLLAGIARNRGRLSLFAFPLFLWFSTRLFSGIRIALNEVFDVSARTPRHHFLVGWVLSKLRDAGMVVTTLLLFSVNTALSAGIGVLEARGAGARPMLAFFLSSLGRVLTEGLAYGFAVILFFVVYKFASIRRLPWRPALVASNFTALAFEVAKRLFGLYLRHLASVQSFTPNASLGALILFVLWLYYTAIVFLLGGVVAETWDMRDRQQRQRAVLA